MRKNGQAIVETLIAIVVIIVILTSVVQVFRMTNTRTEALDEAREIAGDNASIPLSSGMQMISNPDYFGDTTVFNLNITEESIENRSDWTYIDAVPNNNLTVLHNDATIINTFGLVKGESTKTVRLDDTPGFKHLIYDADSITFDSTVWMTFRTGIY